MSPSTGVWCTPAQYIAEIMCQRKADRYNEGKLPHKFWSDGKWGREYVYQVGCANQMIKRYGHIYIIKALETPRGLKIYSLKFPHLVNIIVNVRKEEESKQRSGNVGKENAMKHEAVEPAKHHNFNNKQTLNRLREIDGKKEERDSNVSGGNG